MAIGPGKPNQQETILSLFKSATTNDIPEQSSRKQRPHERPWAGLPGLAGLPRSRVP